MLSSSKDARKKTELGKSRAWWREVPLLREGEEEYPFWGGIWEKT